MKFIKNFILIFLLFLGLAKNTNAQSLDSVNSLQISLLTCGAGEEMYSMYGHTAIRIQDKGNGSDEVYNYGLFDFWDPDFYPKFLKGSLLYFVGKSTFSDFMSEYEEDKRSVKEDVLDINQAEAKAIEIYLKNNLKPENRAYHYDFVYDNCATRVRDIFPSSLGDKFKWGPVFENKQQLTFRNVLDEYEKNNHWVKFGINILLGSETDKVMNNEQAMFLPDLLRSAVKSSTLNGKPLVSQDSTLLPGAVRSEKTLNPAIWTMAGLLLFTMLVFFIPSLRFLKSSLTFILLLSTGLIGSLALFMWIGTAHRACNNNFNVLWALPINIFIAFTVFKPRRWHALYAKIAVGLLMLTLILHLVGVQSFPLPELLPLLFCLLYCYLFLIKRKVTDLKPAETIA